MSETVCDYVCGQVTNVSGFQETIPIQFSCHFNTTLDKVLYGKDDFWILVFSPSRFYVPIKEATKSKDFNEIIKKAIYKVLPEIPDKVIGTVLLLSRFGCWHS